MNRREEIEKVILGSYSNFDDAKDDAIYCSQAEVLLHLLNGKNVFLSGGAGSGKSYVLEEYVKLRKKLNPDAVVAVTATTGLASLNIGGETIHKLAGLGIQKTSYAAFLDGGGAYTKNFEKVQKKLASIDVLIIDEISMLSAQGLDFVMDRVLDAKGKYPQVILAGDFTQLPPVARQEDIVTYGDAVASFCYKCRSWKLLNLVTCYLDKSWRAKDQSLKIILENISIGYGRSPETIELLNTIKTTDVVEKSTASVLMTKNAQVDYYNEECQKQNPHDEHYYTAFYSSEQARSYAQRMGIPDVLILKEGDRVMITQNISSAEEVRVFDQDGDEVSIPIRNGMIGTFKLKRGKPCVHYTRAGRDFDIVFEDVHLYTHEEDRNRFDKYTQKWSSDVLEHNVLQYPLRLAYAISVHKSQGQTLDNVVLDLTDCWTENLGYVALSRVRSTRDIILLKKNGRLGSPKALLVSNDSLTIKEEILADSLDNRIQDYESVLTWILEHDPVREKRSEKGLTKSELHKGKKF